ncbi:MAG: hypothetical protein PVI94_03110, partial [Desulfobacterales bacterium]
DDTNIDESFTVKLREMKLLSRKNEISLIDSIWESNICKNPFFAIQISTALLQLKGTILKSHH